MEPNSTVAVPVQTERLRRLLSVVLNERVVHSCSWALAAVCNMPAAVWPSAPQPAVSTAHWPPWPGPHLHLLSVQCLIDRRQRPWRSCGSRWHRDSTRLHPRHVRCECCCDIWMRRRLRDHAHSHRVHRPTRAFPTPAPSRLRCHFRHRHSRHSRRFSHARCQSCLRFDCMCGFRLCRRRCLRRCRLEVRHPCCLPCRLPCRRCCRCCCRLCCLHRLRGLCSLRRFALREYFGPAIVAR